MKRIDAIEEQQLCMHRELSGAGLATHIVEPGEVAERAKQAKLLVLYYYAKNLFIGDKGLASFPGLYPASQLPNYSELSLVEAWSTATNNI